MLPSVIVSVATLSNSLVVSSFSCVNCYGCYTPTLGPCFWRFCSTLSFFGIWSGSMVQSYMQLHYSCIEWLFIYHTRFLPYIWMYWGTYLCIQGGALSLSLETRLLHIESGYQAWYNSHSSIHTYPSQCGSWLCVVGEISSRMASCKAYSMFQLWCKL